MLHVECCMLQVTDKQALLLRTRAEVLGLNPAMVSGGGGQVATDYRTSKLHWIPDDNAVGR